MKEYVIFEEKWYASNGCDCCVPTEMTSYGFEDENGEKFLFSSVDGALEELLMRYGVRVVYE